MTEHQKFQKRSQKIQSIQDKRKHLQKENAAAEGEMRKQRDEVKQKEERNLFFCRIRSRKARWQMQTWQQNFRGCKAAEERRGSNASQTGNSCLEVLGQQIAAVCATLGPN